MASFTETELQGWRRNAAHYDALCLPATSQAFQPVLDALGDIRKRAVLEMACGTGHLARLLSVKGAHVTAIDFAAGAARGPSGDIQRSGLRALAVRRR
jgi:2-polyprenyl-3-methyl-5-hydroxy-6-metoxy-1,4-benzoquinol methylase